MQLNTREYLSKALKQAEKALSLGNYPFGAILVDENRRVVSSGSNENFSLGDISAHAEIQCLRKVNIKLLLKENYEHFLFCSGEPCYGCSFFIARTNISRVYWALSNPQKGGLGDTKNNHEMKSFFSKIELFDEPYEDLKEQSKTLLKEYSLKVGRIDKAKLYG